MPTEAELESIAKRKEIFDALTLYSIEKKEEFTAIIKAVGNEAILYCLCSSMSTKEKYAGQTLATYAAILYTEGKLKEESYNSFIEILKTAGTKLQYYKNEQNQTAESIVRQWEEKKTREAERQEAAAGSPAGVGEAPVEKAMAQRTSLEPTTTGGNGQEPQPRRPVSPGRRTPPLYVPPPRPHSPAPAYSISPVSDTKVEQERKNEREAILQLAAEVTRLPRVNSVSNTNGKETTRGGFLKRILPGGRKRANSDTSAPSSYFDKVATQHWGQGI